MIVQLFVVAGLMATVQYANAECANACNGHGKCTSYDMCICNRNWQAADCSERVCMFGLAHVDTPKGDLDASGGLSNADKVVIDNSFVYPYGTTEQFPQMQDTDLQVIADSAHYYMECSNKGRCDRTTGECQCFEGYDGVACQRASCPGYPQSCSGHGVCKSIKQLAEADHGNVYKLWDKDTTMGCECDSGYFGPDCSQRKCKFGVDPLYLDDAATVKYSIFDFATLSTAPAASIDSLFTNGESDIKTGYWSIRYYDNHGEDWVTTRIAAGGSCDDVVGALEGLPNNVIPSGSIECTKTDFFRQFESNFTITNAYYDAQNDATNRKPYRLTYKLALWEAQTSSNFGELSPATPVTDFRSSNETTQVRLSGHIYRLKFYGNPGKLQQPEIELYLDGKRPSLISPGGKVITKVWTDGQQGEDNDYFADHCDGVTVTIGRKFITAALDADVANVPQGGNRVESFLNGMTSAEKNLLKKCLGTSDLDETNNQDVYNWDYGTYQYPHIVKLVRTVTTYTDGGYYAVLYFDNTVSWDQNGNGGTFRLVNPFMPPDAFLTDNYDIYTTKGTLALTSEKSEATFGFASKYIFTVNTNYDTQSPADTYNGDISCELGADSAYNTLKLSNIESFNGLYHCLNKTDMFTVLNWDYTYLNPPHINLYTAQRLHKSQATHRVSDAFDPSTANQGKLQLSYMSYMITSDLATNWAAAVGGRTPDATTGAHGIPQFRVYKFIPAPASTYNYVAECSNRGLCDRDGGVCKCFPGYTSDSCHEQSSLSV